MSCAEIQPLLHPYLDGELDLVRSLDLEAHLQQCPACSQAYRNLEALRSAVTAAAPYFAPPPGLEARVRAAVRQAQPPSPAPRRWPGPWLAVAATLAAVLVGAWGLAAALGGPGLDDSLAQAVVAGHIRSLMPGHLTDVQSSDQHTVKPWFAGRLDFSPSVVDLAPAGFPLIGGRLDYLANRPVAALVYQYDKHLINVFLWPAAGPAATAPVASVRQGYNLVTWTQGGMVYWAVSDLNPTELAQFVQLLQHPPGS